MNAILKIRLGNILILKACQSGYFSEKNRNKFNERQKKEKNSISSLNPQCDNKKSRKSAKINRQ
jgi:hypothetical protein